MRNLTRVSPQNVAGVVLAGTHPWQESCLESALPRPLMPVAQEPLVCYPLRWLSAGGVRAATLCANGSSRKVRACLGDGARVALELTYFEDRTPRGAAGCVRDAAPLSGADTFVVIEGTIVPQLDLGDLLEAHAAAGAALTVVVASSGSRGGSRAERPLSPAGIYVVSRRALEHVPPTGFQDLKEALIPRLYQAGERVHTHVAEAPCPRVLGTESYLAVNAWMVEVLARRSGEALVDPSAVVEEGATVVGPVLVGRGVRVRAGAIVVGPTSLGDGCEVGAGATVSRSVLWSGCRIGEGARVDRCVLTDGNQVEANGDLYNVVRVGSGGVPRAAARRHVSAPRGEPSTLARWSRIAAAVAGLMATVSG